MEDAKPDKCMYQETYEGCWNCPDYNECHYNEAIDCGGYDEGED